jgi:hypothetical protein
VSWATLTVEATMTFHPGLPTLADLQRSVGGYVEAVSFRFAGSAATMWLQEEGKLVDEPRRNWKADAIRPLAWGDWTAGEVTFSGGVGLESETLPLAEAQVVEVRRIDREVHVLLLDADGSGLVVG